ncbi:hypothetical protein DFJ74DRAFT_683970 [Hyaloraphidium curvatum]|nr:hypothetical protein DFJ74DRAFT_683970 [Hyaloraphidium curvatum]
MGIPQEIAPGIATGPAPDGNADASPDASPASSTSLPATPFFTASELLTMFPAALPPPDDLIPGAIPPDPAAELREADPLNETALLRALAPYPALRALARLQLGFVPLWSTFTAPLLVANTIAASGTLAASFVFGVDTFGKRNLAITGGLWVLLMLLITVLALSRVSSRKRSFAAEGGDLGSVPFAPPGRRPPLPVPPLDVRRLARRSGCLLALLGHHCALPHPCGGLFFRGLHRAGHLRPANVDHSMVGLFRRAPSLHNGRAAASAGHRHRGEQHLLAAPRPETALPRAPARAGRLPLSIRVCPPRRQDAVGADAEPYEDICERLAVLWRNRFPSRSATPVVMTNYLLVPVIVAIATIISGSCIPAWPFFTFAYGLLLVFTDLVNHASSNSQVSAASSLLRQAAKESTRLLARASAQGLAASPAAAALARHAELLSAYAAADGCKARFAGFVVTYGTARTFAVTLFTLGVGLWSVLRGAGVYVVPDIACPA